MERSTSNKFEHVLGKGVASVYDESRGGLGGGPAHQMGPPLVKRETEMTEDITFLQIAYLGR